MNEDVQLQTKFVTIVQRRALSLESWLLEKVEPLFMIETHMSPEERLRLVQIAVNMPQGFIGCEVGSYLGASSCFLGVAAEHLGGTVHCVDAWDNRANDGEPPRDTFEDFKRNIAPYASRLIIHRGESGQMSREVPDGLDLLFLDADHHYEGVRADLFNYAPKLKRGGFLLMHDFTYDAVQKAASEYIMGPPQHPMHDKGIVGSLKYFQVA